MIQEVLLASAGIVGAFLLYKTLIFIYYVIDGKFKGYPMLVQPLFYAMKQIPLLANHVFLNNHDHMAEMYRQYNPKHKWLKLVSGANTAFRTANPADIRALTITKASKTGKPFLNYQFLRLYGENIVTVSDNVQWKIHRHICGPAFDEQHLKYMSAVCNDSMNLLFKRWSSYPTSNQSITIDPYKEFADVTMDIIGKTAFGYDLQVLTDTPKPITGNHKMSFKDALETSVTSTLHVRIMVPSFLQFLFSKQMRAIKEVEQYIGDIIALRRDVEASGDSTSMDLLSMLLRTNDSTNDAKYKLTNGELMSNAHVVLFAGHDTTSTAMQWMSYELARHPEIQEKMREEIKRELGNEMPLYDDTKKLAYMRQVINENLRLHPPVAFVMKKHDDDFELSGGYTVPAKTVIVADIYNVHHDADVWPEPKAFKPERFEQLPQPCTFMPFSVGNRSCIGANFSLAEQCLILIHLLRNFKFELPENFKGVTEVTAGAVVKPDDSLRIVMKPLNASC